MENRKFGALEPLVDVRDYKYEPAMCVKKEDTDVFQESFSLYTPEVKDQGSVNSCVAHASASIEEYFNKVQINSTDPLSVGFIYGCRYAYKGEGMYLRDALKTLNNKGIAKYEEFPYNKEVPEIIQLFESKKKWETNMSNRITGYFNINEVNRMYKMKRALQEHGPLMVSIPWYNDMTVENGIMHTDEDCDYGLHCVVIYGWTKDGWLIHNSWGSGWGDNGHAVYPYKYTLREVWGITDTIIFEEDIKTKYTNVVFEFFYKTWNKIVNFFNKIFKK